MTPSTELLDRMLDPLGRAFSPDVARKILELRADAQVQARLDELAEKANEGQLTEIERGEYETLISTNTLISILQAKARRCLSDAQT